MLICSSFSRENGYPLLICSSLSTAQIIFHQPGFPWNKGNLTRWLLQNSIRFSSLTSWTNCRLFKSFHEAGSRGCIRVAEVVSSTFFGVFFQGALDREKNTSPKNQRIAPENGWLGYDRFLLGWLIFRCNSLVSGRVSIEFWDSLIKRRWQKYTLKLRQGWFTPPHSSRIHTQKWWALEHVSPAYILWRDYFGYLFVKLRRVQYLLYSHGICLERVIRSWLPPKLTNPPTSPDLMVCYSISTTKWAGSAWKSKTSKISRGGKGSMFSPNTSTWSPGLWIIQINWLHYIYWKAKQLAHFHSHNFRWIPPKLPYVFQLSCIFPRPQHF